MDTLEGEEEHLQEVKVVGEVQPWWESEKYTSCKKLNASVQPNTARDKIGTTQKFQNPSRPFGLGFVQSKRTRVHHSDHTEKENCAKESKESVCSATSDGHIVKNI